jgi:hypothetical protein
MLIMMTSEFNEAARTLVSRMLPTGKIGPFRYVVVGCEQLVERDSFSQSDPIMQNLSDALQSAGHHAPEGQLMLDSEHIGDRGRGLVIAVNLMAPGNVIAGERQAMIMQVFKKHNVEIQFRKTISSADLATLNRSDTTIGRTGGYQLRDPESLKFR